jgi:hypothetical protein
VRERTEEQEEDLKLLWHPNLPEMMLPPAHMDALKEEMTKQCRHLSTMKEIMRSILFCTWYRSL